MSDLKWKEAIVSVFEDEKKALHYTDVAKLAEKSYRKSLGATPQDTVSAMLTTDINQLGKVDIAKVNKKIN